MNMRWRTTVTLVSLFLVCIVIDAFVAAAGVDSSDDHYIIGVGRGDLSKGSIVCQRVAELAARADVAKQIRVSITERMVDRLRERSGKPAEQDIELIQEEEVREVLRDVRIIEHVVDTSAGICTARAALRRISPNGVPPDSSSQPNEHSLESKK